MKLVVREVNGYPRSVYRVGVWMIEGTKQTGSFFYRGRMDIEDGNINYNHDDLPVPAPIDE
jgi:hypothetical protein